MGPTSVFAINMKVKINTCSFEELLSIPTLDESHAIFLLGLREREKVLTPEHLHKVPYLEITSEILGAIDFSPQQAEAKRAIDRIEKCIDSFQGPSDSGACMNISDANTPMVSGLNQGRYNAPRSFYEGQGQSGQMGMAYTSHTPYTHMGMQSPGVIQPQIMPTVPNQGRLGPMPVQYLPVAPNPNVYRDTNLPSSRYFNYDGEGSWSAFYAKFARWAEMNRWSLDQCRDQLCFSLSGKASEYFALLSQRDHTISFHEIIRKMERRFGREGLPQTAQAEFGNLKQNQGESLETWADRVLTLATRAFTELPEFYMNQQAVSKFCQGALDKEAANYASNDRPATIDQAIDRMRLYQHNHLMIYGRPSRKDVRQVDSVYNTCIPAPGYAELPLFQPQQFGYDQPQPQVSAVRSNKDIHPTWLDFEKLESRLTKKMSEHQDKISKDISDFRAELMGEVKNLVRSRSPSRRDRSPSPQPRGNRCFFCSQEGHWKESCPVKAEMERSSPKKVTFDSPKDKGSVLKAASRPRP